MSDPLSKMMTSPDAMSKMLPAVPDMDTQLALAAKMIDKKTATHKGSHSYGSYFLEYSLMAEFNLLLKQKLPGIYCIPSAKSSLTWYGVLFIRQGAYQEGVFRFTVQIPENYPDGDVPKVVFDNAVFHPSVDPNTHSLNVKQGFHKWKRNVNHIWQLLLYTRRVFYKIDLTNPLNVEAASLYERDIEQFQVRAKSCVTDWKEQLYLAKDHPDPHYLTFSSFQEQIHGPVRDKMKRGAEGHSRDEEGGGVVGDRKSYVATGSLTIFSEKLLPSNSEREGPKSMPK
eukprot:GFUD01016990.1.p1 GENE.GFUD01016990.1~~GFUD01016990.1.p1  ORF type:complete len:284 (-),score=79.27 GFUD01016990.1:376-1227(-)